MSMMYLGDQLDIHCGGADHVDIHHTNEIAQSEAATGRKFFNVWMHGAFLNIQGGKKMAKSEENFLTLENALVRRGIPPLAYRFASFLSHYRKPMEYSEESIQGARNGLEHLHNQVRDLARRRAAAAGRVAPRAPREVPGGGQRRPQPCRAPWPWSRSCSRATCRPRRSTRPSWTSTGCSAWTSTGWARPRSCRPSCGSWSTPASARAARNWAESDRLRDEIQAHGYTVKDTRDGMQVLKS